MWSIEFCHRQWPGTTFNVILFLSGNKYSLLFRLPVSDRKSGRFNEGADIADDVE